MEGLAALSHAKFYFMTAENYISLKYIVLPGPERSMISLASQKIFSLIIQFQNFT